MKKVFFYSVVLALLAASIADAGFFRRGRFRRSASASCGSPSGAAACSSGQCSVPQRR